LRAGPNRIVNQVGEKFKSWFIMDNMLYSDSVADNDYYIPWEFSDMSLYRVSFGFGLTCEGFFVVESERYEVAFSRCITSGKCISPCEGIVGLYDRHVHVVEAHSRSLEYCDHDDEYIYFNIIVSCKRGERDWGMISEDIDQVVYVVLPPKKADHGTIGRKMLSMARKRKLKVFYARHFYGGYVFYPWTQGTFIHHPNVTVRRVNFKISDEERNRLRSSHSSDYWQKVLYAGIKTIDFMKSMISSSDWSVVNNTDQMERDNISAYVHYPERLGYNNKLVLSVWKKE
jgi:hypothetical protein